MAGRHITPTKADQLVVIMGSPYDIITDVSDRRIDARALLQEEQLTEAQKQWQTERRGGNYGMGTKEMQARNYMNRKETEQKRRELFDTALSKFKKNDIEGVRSCMSGSATQSNWTLQHTVLAWGDSVQVPGSAYTQEGSSASDDALKAARKAASRYRCQSQQYHLPCRPCRTLRRSSAWSPRTTWETTSQGSLRSSE